MTHTAYISGPLQAAADLDEARRFYEYIAGICRSVGWGAYLPHNETDPALNAEADPAMVYRTDIGAMEKCDVVIAYVGAPSSGVGAELGIASVKGQPIIGVWANGDRPSRFIEGLLQEYAGAETVTYADDGELATKLGLALDECTLLAGTRATAT